MYTALLRKCSVLLSGHDVFGYIDSVNKIPRLSAEAEIAAFYQYKEHGDEESKNSLICSNLWLGVWTSVRFKFMGDHQSDFIQESIIGIIKALPLYNPSAGVRFSTFANIYIKAEVHNYMIANWRMVKVATTKSKRKVFHNLYKHMKPGEFLSESKILEIAKLLSVSISDIKAIQSHMNFDTRMGMPMGQDGHCIEDLLSNDQDSPERIALELSELKHDRDRLDRAMSTLNQRELDVIESRVIRDKPIVLGILSEKYNVSKERIRQIELIALKKMRDVLEAA